MKQIKEKDRRILEGFCGVTAIATGVLCILYLLDLLQNHWFLSFTMGLAVLLHVSLSLLFFIRRRHLQMTLAVLAAVFYAGCLIYFM